MTRVVTAPRFDRVRTLSKKPVVAGTRIPVSLIRNRLDHGYDVARVLQAYPTLTAEDVEAAVRYSDSGTPSAGERDRIK